MLQACPSCKAAGGTANAIYISWLSAVPANIMDSTAPALLDSLIYSQSSPFFTDAFCLNALVCVAATQLMLREHANLRSYHHAGQ